MIRGLLDTGALLAILDPSDPWHAGCIGALGEFRLPLLTTEAVLTEVFHLIHHARVGMEEAWTVILSGAVAVAPIEQLELRRLHLLMSRHADRPMDFADASVVYIAEREGVSTVLTVDIDDFETYRIEGKRRFQVLPLRPSPRSPRR